VPSRVVSPRKEEHADDRARFERLTDREQVVLKLFAEGYTAPEIGEKLSISPKTVDTYKQRINEKLHITHRTDYVKLALRLGLLVTSSLPTPSSDRSPNEPRSDPAQ
jgi:two-component system, NarL family, response regulator NreC